ncbi:hypothetical protein LPN01_01055 [Sphingomonas sp. A2-49]|uniref:hypothetical protein n=1 Tax=Sphingomonas sp. A2-49 TaxID=1391375 RepID=UPI0021D2712C|nr:hypothetical protein [Sphingomonas sp. A2-49]MCU6452661.1 hypothetical protein [Sphingomonas sp. A2-49]
MLLLAACGDRDAGATAATVLAGEPLACARGAAPLREGCTVERCHDADGLILTVRNPDGGFHRLRVTHDGRGVVAADGAEPARVAVRDRTSIEVAIGGDRYRLPATIGAAR